MFTSIGTDMKATILKTQNELKNVQKILSITAKKRKKTVHSNLKQLVDFIQKMHLDYENVTLEKCDTDYNPL